jgi:hypothetical protein
MQISPLNKIGVWADTLLDTQIRNIVTYVSGWIKPLSPLDSAKVQLGDGVGDLYIVSSSTLRLCCNCYYDVKLNKWYRVDNSVQAAVYGFSIDGFLYNKQAAAGTGEITWANYYTWIAPTLLNNWADTGGTGQITAYCKDTAGFVHLHGLVSNGTGIICTLPAGFRPTALESFGTAGNGAFANIYVDSDGNVGLLAGDGPALSLCGISFRAV